MQSTALRFDPAPVGACTLNAMQADNPQTPGADSSSPQARGASRAGEREERVGPLLLSRWRKDDGRTLLLYRHPDDDQAGGA
jgi:hypothetical protein